MLDYLSGKKEVMLGIHSLASIVFHLSCMKKITLSDLVFMFALRQHTTPDPDSNLVDIGYTW